MKKWLLLSVILCFVINTANSITQQKISPTLVTNPNKVFPENRNSEWSDRTPVNDYEQDLLTYGRDTLLVSYTDGDPNGPWYLIKPDGSTEDIPNASGVASNIKANGEILSFNPRDDKIYFYNPATKGWSDGEDIPKAIDYSFTIDGVDYTYSSNVHEVFPLNQNEVILVSFRNIVAYNINPQDTAYQTTRNIHTLPNEDIIEQGTINASAYCDETGELYFAVGNEIRIVDAEGNVSTLLSLPEGEVVLDMQKDINAESSFAFTAGRIDNNDQKRIVFYIFEANQLTEIGSLSIDEQNSVSSITSLIKDGKIKEVLFSSPDGTYKFENLSQQLPEVVSVEPSEGSKAAYYCHQIVYTFDTDFPLASSLDLHILRDNQIVNTQYTISIDGKTVTVLLNNGQYLVPGNYQFILSEEEHTYNELNFEIEGLPEITSQNPSENADNIPVGAAIFTADFDKDLNPNATYVVKVNGNVSDQYTVSINGNSLELTKNSNDDFDYETSYEIEVVDQNGLVVATFNFSTEKDTTDINVPQLTDKDDIKIRNNGNSIYITNSHKVKEINVYNTIGQTVKFNQNGNRIKLRSGMYIIEIEDENGNITRQKVAISK